ncbi:hypothetical protein PFISCL1PPCAC_8114 [Pristionchus fissidentatus]|uniref:Uncharacterized protein n=1 Tax=Pristionchus fissidentatus TaxID=1538716 RepID=A0AAV5VDK0_9BILA|nr:hypothetical protein PFISCL1PPCAC_8114 [Pristionchus fissidentatus]
MLHKMIAFFFALLVASALAGPIDSGYPMVDSDAYDGMMPVMPFNREALSRMTRSNGKPTFIRFGKRSAYNRFE